ncbi:hypothetical protein BpHYR1_005187 [Brachionus plicatilis]|uniref:Integrase p58-like C-terminal domain-containing protein n=1 Tax=Brachionus plicatilis TaxID=10195 RepID=A0A3M7SU51_BRAPC|nr:hypothetical protein BpHYR1_005187 [Brachionus plicatilis]
MVEQGLTHKLNRNKWKGPFKVKRIINDVNAEIEQEKGKTKIVHINRLNHAESLYQINEPKSILKKKNYCSQSKVKKHVSFGNYTTMDLVKPKYSYNLRPRIKRQWSQQIYQYISYYDDVADILLQLNSCWNVHQN